MPLLPCLAGTSFWAIGTKRSMQNNVLSIVGALFSANMFLVRKAFVAYQPFKIHAALLPVAAIIFSIRCVIMFFGVELCSALWLPERGLCISSGTALVGLGALHHFRSGPLIASTCCQSSYFQL